MHALLQESVTFKFINSVLSCWAACPFCSKVLESSDAGADSAKGAKMEKTRKVIGIIKVRVRGDSGVKNCSYRKLR